MAKRGPWKRISALPQHSMGILDFTLGHFFFFAVEFSGPRKYSRVLYVNVLSYHHVDGIRLVFLAIFFSLVHR